MEDVIKPRGFFRVHITENDKIVGDTGWQENAIVNLGFNQYLVSGLGAVSGSKQISHMALGTGTEPGLTDTSLNGELAEDVRVAVTAATSSNSKTLRLTATFASSDSFVTDTRNISNIGLFNTSSGGTIFAGNTYASSSVATNQQVNCTYDITFS